MFTRKINKDTATQLNTDKIGVLVHPSENPPIVTVDDIVVDYSYQTIAVTNNYNNSIIITENNDYAYHYNGSSEEISGQMYYRWDLIGSSSLWGDVLWGTELSINPGDLLYVKSGTPEDPHMIQVTNIASIFNINGTFIRNDENIYYNSNISGTYVVNGDFLCDSSTGNKVGYCPGGLNTVVAEDMTFVKGSTSSDYQTWTNGDLVSSGFGTRVLYTATDSPAVGDAALFTLNNLDYNVQTIKAIDTTETPVDPDPVECTVSYSIDGKTWTDVDTVLTDDNNVICNIPKYVYLKFSQDVEITEE